MASINRSLLGILSLAIISCQATGQFSITLQNQTQLCEQYESYNTSDSLYTVSTNEWGADGSGTQCITVGNNGDLTSNATAFSSTWGWNDNPTLVHAYPNVKLESNILPLVLRNLSSLTLDVTWSYGGGSSDTASDNFAALEEVSTKANVAIDMFLDADSATSTNTTMPAYEIMVWLGSFGGMTPIGYSNGTRATKKISSTKFDLYVGANNAGQTVFSWVGTTNVTSFSGDISLLVRHVAFYGGPTTNDYLGVYQFGTETIHTADAANVTFTAKSVNMGIAKGIAPVDNAAGALGSNRIFLIITSSLVALSLAV